MKRRDGLKIWHFDRASYTLDHYDKYGNVDYYIELDRCRTQGAILNWIVHISKKRWATDAVLADLIRQLDHLLNVRGLPCDHAHKQDPIDVRARIKKVAAFREEVRRDVLAQKAT